MKELASMLITFGVVTLMSLAITCAGTICFNVWKN